LQIRFFTVFCLQRILQFRCIMAIKIVVVADLHLGRRSTGVTGDQEILTTKAAWGRLVQWAVENRVDAVAFTGDVVDQDNAFFESIGPLRLGFDRLGQAGIEVYLVAGNHDFNVLPQMVEVDRPHVHLLGSRGTWECATLSRNGQTVQLVGWSFPSRYVKTSPISSLRHDLWDINHPVIGLMHGDLYDPNSPYCPIRQSELAVSGVRTWLLGHIHKPATVDIAGTSIYYPGSLQALSAKESGRHGFLLLSVEGHRVTVETIPFSAVRYDVLEINITQSDTRETLNASLVSGIQRDAQTKLEEMEAVRHLSYDLRLIGEHEQEEQVSNWAKESQNNLSLTVGSGITATVRSVSSAITPAIGDLAELAAEPSPVGLLAGTILAIRNGTSTALLQSLEAQWDSARLQLQTNPVYLPLRLGELPSGSQPNARDYLLRECQRMLSQLRQQIKTTANG
jgi:DNA repair exonuclease SbcCD nuclease subunit